VKGIFQLQTANDLLAKLQHDFERMSAAPSDAYAAFDFFVTAEHMLDWLHPGSEGKAAREAERNSSPLLQAVSHLATGAKHMIPQAKHHDSVEHADVAQTGYGAGAYGSGVYGGRNLTIDLKGMAAAQLGESIAPLDLARQVLAYWESRLGV
jgi:hypothetical protein